MSPSALVSSLSVRELKQQLGDAGICLSVSPFVMHVRSPMAVVAEGISVLYADHAWTAPGPGVFSDFHVSIQPQRRLFKTVCVFDMDGYSPFTPLAAEEAFAFLEWGMNWCVTSYVHDLVTIHAAVLERGGRALILPAPPGSGKSTLCATLMLRGWRLLSDEMTLLDPVTGKVLPFARPVSLKNQSIELIRAFAPDAVMGPVARDTQKGTVAHLKASAKSIASAGVAAVPAWVVFPKYESSASLDVERRPRAEALVDLASNSFNQHVHGRKGFEAMADLIDRSDCYDLHYGDLSKALAWFDALEPRA